MARELDAKLDSFHRTRHKLYGIIDPLQRQVFLEQLVESIRRVKYISVMRDRDISILRTDPQSDLFDPLKAAALHHKSGSIDEAFWLVFLSVHFGKHVQAGWSLVRNVYGRLGNGGRWDWITTSARPASFVSWLARHQNILRRDGRFGNHRKYQSLDAYKPSGTGAAIESYIVDWVQPPRDHTMLIEEARQSVGVNPKKVFDHLYKSLDSVDSFGRTAKVDFLSMLGKLGLAPIEPPFTYLTGATGPLRGARLLLENPNTIQSTPRELEARLVELGEKLGVGMQELEDALCNWQKSPASFIRFRG